MVHIAVDIMGGDFCPNSNLEGAYDALQADKDIFLLLAGPEETIREAVGAWSRELQDRVSIIPASEVITTEESPVAAVRKKKDSSLAVGARLVREGKASAFVSAGSTGAILAAGQLIVGRLPGVQRPPLAAMLPTQKGPKLFLDLGANVDAKPEWLCQFARMGTIYMERVQHIASPSVKLVNLGVEEEKGNALIKAANPMLREMEGINYQGFIESRDVIMGEADIIVADAFTGNAILKTIEGTVEFVMNAMKDVFKTSFLTALGALAIKKPLKEKVRGFKASEHGGAMLLGLNGLVMKCHGNAGREDIKNAILKSAQFVREDVCGRIRDAFTEAETGTDGSDV